MEGQLLHNGAGQLSACTGPSCAPTHDADGRITKVTLASGTWSYLYDASGRLTSACGATACTGSGFARLDLVYDGEGHRTRLVETPVSGSVRTTDLRSEGGRVVGESEVRDGVTTTRAFTLDEAGTIVKVTITTSGGSTSHDGTYLVTYNGHGDALTFEKIETSGALTVANRFSYTTWGTPSVTTHDGHPDHRFRYRYVGRFGVADDTTALVSSGLLYMHARHYSPELGRFLQPDPSALEANLYGYAENSPVTKVDPSGEMAIPGGLPPIVFGNLVELHVIRHLRVSGWRIVDTQVRFGGGQRVVDIVAQRAGTMALFEVKANRSHYEPLVRRRDAVIRLAYSKVTGQKLAGYLARVQVNTAGMVTRVTVRDMGTGRFAPGVFRPGGSGVGAFLRGFGGGGKRARK